MIKRVAVIGTHQVGKTFLVKRVFEQVKQQDPDNPVILVKEQAAEWISEFRFDWTSCPPHVYAEYERALFHYYMFAIQSARPILMDRSPIDPIAYAMLLCPVSVTQELTKYLEEYVPYISENLVIYYYHAKNLTGQAGLIQDNLDELLEEYYFRQVFKFTREDFPAVEEQLVKYFLQK